MDVVDSQQAVLLFPMIHVTGMNVLCLQAVKAVADMVQSHAVPQLVVDPVLVATSGDSLAAGEVAAAMKEHLFPLATVITPNLPEASALLDDRPVEDLAAMKQVSFVLLRTYSCNTWWPGCE